MAVNVATGSLELEYADVQISGVVALTWDRTYSSNALDLPVTPLGAGWSCQYFSTLRVDASGFVLTGPNGTVTFDVDPDHVISRGGSAINYSSFAELFRRDDKLVVQRWDILNGRVWRYCFPTGRVGQTLQLASIEDPSDRGLDVSWTATGRLAVVKQRLEGGALHVSYNQRGLIEAVTYAGPRGVRQTMVSYDYDHGGHLATVRDQAEFATRYESNSEGRLIREIQKDGGVFRYVYDNAGRCVRTSGLDEYDAKTIRYFEGALYSEVVDSYGSTWVYRYNGNGQILEETDPLGARQTREYDEHGRMVSKADQVGAVTRWQYDEYGNRTKLIDALGQEWNFRFNRDHLLTAIVSPAGHEWTREYDAINRMTASRDPVGGLWSVHYGSDGLPSSIINPNGFATEQRFEEGRMTHRSDREGNWSQYVFDDFGRLIGEVDAGGSTYTFSYDLAGNLSGMSWPDGSSISMEYDAAGNPIRFTDQLGLSVSYRYGTCRRLLEHRDRAGHVVRYQWGTEPGRLEGIVNEKGEQFDLEWDAAGRLVRTNSFDGVELAFEYDAAGRTAKITNGAGETQELTRDVLGRIITKQLSTGDRHSFEYDPLSNVIKATNNDHVVVLVRDPLERIVRESQDDRWVATEYDGVGKSTQLSSSLGDEFEFSFDGNSALRRVAVSGNQVFASTRDAIGQEVARELLGGTRLTQVYDARGLLRNQSLARQSLGQLPTELVYREFHYDNRGLLTQTIDADLGPSHYDYDECERLTRVIHGTLEERWEYDPAGNQTNVTVVDREARRVDQVYATGNRLLRSGNTSYEYDGNGRLIRKTEEREELAPRVWTYRWNALNFLVGLTTPEGEQWRYTYDALGRRLSKSCPTRRVTYLWSRFSLLREMDGSLYGGRSWIFEPDSYTPLAQIDGGRLYSIIADQNGIPRELVDELGGVTKLIEPHLATASRQSRPCPLGFQGQLFDDESGLYYSWFRYYDPAIRRYVSQDPKSVLAGLNLYLYAPDPLRSADPLGLDSRKLDRALGGTTGDGKQAHHIIPEQVMNQNKDMIDRAKTLGFEPDGKNNGILLPSDDAVATAAGLPSHRGSHPEYNAQVGAEVAEIRNQWKAGLITDGEMLQALEDVQLKWGAKIENNDEDLPRGKTSACKLG